MATRLCLALLALIWISPIQAEESIWIEAEHLQGIKGYCWPSGQPAMRQTKGNWGLSGPGWAAEWVQGGESGFLSIACSGEDDKAVAFTEVEIPVEGAYQVWVRYRDNRGSTSRFQVKLTPAGGKAIALTYGTKPIVDEDNEMKLYWNWAFAWEGHEASLPKGKARLELLSTFTEKECRQIDCIVLTTDKSYRPLIKERPRHPTWELLESLKKSDRAKAESLTRKSPDFTVPAEWKPRTFRDKGFLYLWNMRHTKWASDDPKRVLFPYQVADKETEEAFEKKYAGAADVPIFSDPRIVPVFHGSGPYILETEPADAKNPKAKPNPEARNFVRWLDKNPDRPWGLLLNYHPDNPVGNSAKTNFAKYRDRFVGAVAGESLGYFYPKAGEMEAATKNAKNRRDLAEAITKVSLADNAEKYKKVYGQDWPDAYREVIPCQSVSMPAFAPLSYMWGARTVGYESSAISGGILSMRMAFLRGAARQNGAMFATYRSCNFGDASTIFSDQSTFSKPLNILDNYYSVYSGAGMIWYKMDIWYQYLAGSSMFYHEQGFDEFWRPGGTSAAGKHEIQLSPKGKLVDRFLKLTAKHKDRGTPFTPVAFLVDYAHGWDPAPFQPHSFDDHAKRPDLTHHSDHDQMLREYFWTAYYPIGPKGTEPTTATNEVYVPGIFGDRFDVIYAYPDAQRWKTIQTYPAVIVTGDIDLTAPEGVKLAQYIESGGTLLIADAHLTGPGLSALKLPELGAVAEASGYRWNPEKSEHASQLFRYRAITGGTPLGTTSDGKVFCAAIDRGKGRLIVLSIPRGLGIDGSAHPILAQLFASLTQGSTPIEVKGDVEWLLNRTETSWIVTLLNPAGAMKPQQGVFPTDAREKRTVTIQCKVPVQQAADWLYPEDTIKVEKKDGGSRIELTVPAGGVRVIELK
jgi:hypothetical protein